jgi:hypothetical protein
MLERCVLILRALGDRAIRRSDLARIVLDPAGARYLWESWQPALGLLRRFGLVLVQEPCSVSDPVYVKAPCAADVDSVAALRRRLLTQATARHGQLTELQHRVLQALVDEAGRGTIETLREALQFSPDRAWEQVYQAIADLAAMNLLVELSELPEYQPVIRLTNEGWILALTAGD